jgi:uncharacterized membrane protein
MENTPPPVAPPFGAEEDKTAAILSYLTVIGFIVAVVLHGQKKTRLGAFHMRQALGIYLTGVVAGALNFFLIFIPILGWLAVLCIWLLLIAGWIMGLIGAAQGQLKPVPVIGETIQKLLGTAFD